jgi:hypothetical protein
VAEGVAPCRLRVGCLGGTALVLLYFTGLVAPGFVLADGLRAAWRARQRALKQRPADIAQLERELGLPPS